MKHGEQAQAVVVHSDYWSGISDETTQEKYWVGNLLIGCRFGWKLVAKQKAELELTEISGGVWIIKRDV